MAHLDVLNYISHGISKSSADEDGHGVGPEGDEEQDGEGRATRDPLGEFTVNLIERARDNKIDPLIGRDAEVQRTIQVLCRRRKNNPIYVGDSGVGKTAIAEGLALRIQRGEVPPALKDAQIYMLVITGGYYRPELNIAVSSSND